MAQSAIGVANINIPSQLPAATLPLDPAQIAVVAPATGKRPGFKVTIAALLAGASAILGNMLPTGFYQWSFATGLAAVGTNRATALALTKQSNIVTTAASTAVGVVLPSAAAIGVGGYVDVYNDGPSNSFHVYAAGSDTIDGTAGSTGVVLTNAFSCRYVVSAALTFLSYRSAITRSA